MKPSRDPPSGNADLFRSRLENIIDMRHQLIRLADAIAWSFFEDAFEAFYSEEGRPGIPTRMMVGLLRNGWSGSIGITGRDHRNAQPVQGRIYSRMAGVLPLWAIGRGHLGNLS